ncbi:unnamed protein product [Penicillium salamii]|uniref:Uncharacterized protein n=2 Tax=Penicillium TaxID=5073 RepID=A0A9W4I8E7_9EURO|nr:unnamed protein product [Penicillium salamii]CRL30516.1 unnamed protein product [Penicillium camemberti]CAG7966687.1 unnamed protein product [Penicillium salamii]CAG7983500.1 unnamed protein product [Penicillium salamii]CAG8062337.1 unnamed protein product [Penicillium salamii]
MATQAIEYIWKIARPKNEAIARALMYAAYMTAIQTDPQTKIVLIRSYIHPTTRTGGVYVKDKSHITVSVKNLQTIRSGQHQSSHGYTPHLNSFEVNRVSPSSVIKGDSVGGAWPASMETRPKDTSTGPPALLGPKSEFITWPSEETGE